MSRISSTLFTIGAALALTLWIGSYVASAQGRGGRGGGQPQGDPSKITVTATVHNMKKLQSEPVPPDDVYRGRSLWVERCAFCHDGVGQPTYKTMGPWLGAETVQKVGESAMRAIISAGTTRMPGYRYTLNPQQMDDLFAFLKTVTSDQKPSAAQLAGTPPERSNTGE